MPIVEVNKDDRGVIYAFGKVENGTLKVGQSIHIAPHEIPTQVKSIHNSKEENVKFARPGETVKVMLMGLEDISDV